MSSSIDPRHFRNVLGCYPTGVSVVTALSESGERFGMAVGSFTSISLDPPLVGFFPDKTSSTWPRIERTGRFCINVLAHDQVEICRRFASKGSDKFQDLSHGSSPSGLPLLDDAVAWIDCRLHSVTEIGDHLLVVGEVEALEGQPDSFPLIFFRGGYHDLAGRTAAHS
jgi:3-hydroxy-9,10-secoandrosta-1,3,5(10)-triene-9,17-dione monooxygenase reductase component